jgi:hypothetical protein
MLYRLEQQVGKLNLEMCSEDGSSNSFENICTYLTITDFISQKSLIFISSNAKLTNFENLGLFSMRGIIAVRAL